MAAIRIACFAALLLAGCDEDYVGNDVDALASGNKIARQAAAANLGGKRDPRIVPALVAALHDPEEDVRCAAAKALGRQSPDAAVPPLAAMLAAHEPGAYCSIEPLGATRDARAVAPLLAEYRRESTGQARAALGALGPVAVAPLVEALRSERDRYRADDLAYSLVEAGGAQALAPLVAAYAADDAIAKENMVLALGLLGDARALPVLTQAADAGVPGATTALARLGGAALDDLGARLDDADPAKRLAASGGLGSARDPAVVPLLKRGLAATDPHVVEGCARALALLAGRNLDASLDDPAFPLHDAAAEVLAGAWDRRDLRVIAAGHSYYLRRHPDAEAPFVEALAAHGDERLATAYLNARSPALRAAAVKWGRAHGLRPCSTETGVSPCRFGD